MPSLETLSAEFAALPEPVKPSAAAESHALESQGDLSGKRENLRRVKEEYVKQYVREQLLEKIATAPPLQAPPVPESIDETVAEAKARVRERHGALNSFLKSVQATSAEINDLRETIGTKLQDMPAPENEDAEDRHHDGLRSHEDLKATQTSLSAELHSHQEAAGASQAEAEALKVKLAAAREELGQLKEVISTLEEEEAQSPASGTPAVADASEASWVEALDKASGEYEEVANWFQAMTSICEGAGAARFMSTEPLGAAGAAEDQGGHTRADGQCIRVMLWNAHPLQLIITPRAGGASAGGSHVLSEATIPSLPSLLLDDLVELASTLSSGKALRLVVSEAAARVHGFHELGQHVKTLKGRGMAVCQSKEGRRLTVTGQDGVVACVCVAPDYPNSRRGVFLESLTSITGRNDKVLAEVRDRINSCTFLSLIDLFDALETENQPRI